VCLVIDTAGVVLGLVHADALSADPATPVAEAMHAAPVTFRPNLGTGQMPDYLHTERISRVLVTTSDGVLIGLLRLGDLDRQRPRSAG
jgi:Mg/Co/Ni transporter MgtE